MFRIEVVNHHKIKPNVEGTIYTGRPGRGERGSPLANPRGPRDYQRMTPEDLADLKHPLDLYNRELRIALNPTNPEAYWNGKALTDAERQAMRDELNRLFSMAESGQTVRLRCFCVDAQGRGACHAQLIKRILLEAARRKGAISEEDFRDQMAETQYADLPMRKDLTKAPAARPKKEKPPKFGDQISLF